MSQKNQALYVGLAVTAAALVAGYLIYSSTTSSSGGESKEKSTKTDSKSSPVRSAKKDATELKTPLVSNTSGRGISTPNSQAEKEVHSKIEELDKAGKKLFKEKKVKYHLFDFWR